MIRLAFDLRAIKYLNMKTNLRMWHDIQTNTSSLEAPSCSLSRSNARGLHYPLIGTEFQFSIKLRRFWIHEYSEANFALEIEDSEENIHTG